MQKSFIEMTRKIKMSSMKHSKYEVKGLFGLNAFYVISNTVCNQMFSILFLSFIIFFIFLNCFSLKLIDW